MPDKMNLDYLKLLYCEFQKYDVMTLSVVGGQPKNMQIPVIKQQTYQMHFSNLWLLLVIIII